jgi:hypothetical protein
VPGWNGAYLVVLAFMVALESMYSHRLLRSMYITDPQWLGYRLSEWVVILVALKVTQVINTGGRYILSDLQAWQQNFSNFFDNETIFGLVTLLIVWGVGGRIADELIDLEANPSVLQQEIDSGIHEDRGAIRGRLANMILMVGMGMVILTALLRFDKLADWIDQPPLRAGVYNILLYFFLGLVLLSLTQFNLLRARWFRDALPVHKEIAGRWILYSAFFILAVALIAALLPTGYSIGLLAVLNYLFFIALAIINLLITLLLLPLLWLYSLLSGLFRKGTEGAPPLELPAIENMPGPSPAAPVPWWELLKSIVFWLVFLGVIAFAVSYYFRENRELWEQIRRMPFFAALARFFDWLGRWLGRVNRQVGTAVQAGLERLRTRRKAVAAARTWRFVNPRRLSPRERVRFYYLAMVRRGGECGYRRHPAQTPFEYSRSLSEAIGALDSLPTKPLDGSTETQAGEREALSRAIVVMTDTFVEARYSQHEITSQDAGLVQRAWARLRHALQSARRNKENG